MHNTNKSILSFASSLIDLERLSMFWNKIKDYISQNTYTDININNVSKVMSSGVVDLDTVITEYQDLSNYAKTNDVLNLLNSDNIIISNEDIADICQTEVN